MLKSDIQKACPGSLIVLFDIDATAIGGDVSRFTGCTGLDGQPVHWRGNAYMPAAVYADGFEVVGQGALPRPTLYLSHVNTALVGMVRALNDLVGARVTRWRTFDQYLDGGPDADPNAHFAPDVFRINKPKGPNGKWLEWELVSSMDQQGRKVPGRQVLRDRCVARYRLWTGSGFDYSKVQCPYTGTGYFDEMGVPCEPASDKCGKRVSDCKLRYPDNQPLPFWGFPGTARTRR
nr:phage minor tail protein L [uncultured Pseudodesulfovibrio sp.]